MERPKPSLEELFSPRGVAVVGAGPPASFVTGLVQGLQKAGFPAIYPINPKYTEVLGLPCYPSLQAIPGVVDHVVIGIPAEAALALLDDCAAKGVKSVHFFTAGFSESGDRERAELESTMLSKARAGGFRIIGPNCVGLYVPKSRLLIDDKMPLESGPVAFISQSGGYAQNLPFFVSARGLRFSKLVSYGNALDVDETELLEYFARDPETGIISGYIEGVKDGRRFIGALKEATARKPVVIYNGGTTEAGKRAARGHTASLTSPMAVFDALCRQTRAIRVDDMEELIDVVVALCFAHPLPRGLGVAIVGAGGGPSVLACDEMERAGLRVPPLPPEVQAELRRLLPLAGSIFTNPVDSPNLGSPDAISKAMQVLGKVADIHMLIYHMGFHPITRWGDVRPTSADFLQTTTESVLQATADALVQVRQAAGKPVLVALRPPPDLPGTRDFLAAQEAFAKVGLPVFYSLRQAAKAMARVVAWSETAKLI